MQPKLKKTLYFLFILLASLKLAYAEPEIAVMMDATQESHYLAFGGFMEGLEEAGLIEGKDYVYRVFDIKDSGKGAQDAAEKINEYKPALVLALGNRAAIAAKNAVSDIPVVFSMVQDPAASGIIASMRSSENNFTGSSSDISAFFVFDSIRTIFPKTQRIGVIYDPLRSGAKITEAKMAAELLGMTLVGEPVQSYKMVPEVARSLIDRIDVLWIMPDPTVVTRPSLEYIFVRMLWSKKVIVGYDPYIVKAGALFALLADPFDIGKQAGESASLVLKGIAPSEVPVTMPRKTFYVINAKIAKKIDADIPPAILRSAVEVIE